MLSIFHLAYLNVDAGDMLPSKKGERMIDRDQEEETVAPGFVWVKTAGGGGVDSGWVLIALAFLLLALMLWD